MTLTSEDFYNEMKIGMINRFMTLSEAEQNIMRENIDSEFAKIAFKVLGIDILSGLPGMRSVEEQQTHLESLE